MPALTPSVATASHPPRFISDKLPTTFGAASSLSSLIVLLAIAAAACSPPQPDLERRRSHESSIINGQASTATEDDAVVLMTLSQGFCSATLIAPNLLLTAHHCVAEPQNSQTECPAFGAEKPASSFGVALGQKPSSQAIVARGLRVFTPTLSTICGNDVALVMLDRDVTGVPIRKVRFTPLTRGELTSAVGYGQDASEQITGRNIRRNVRIEGVGPVSQTALANGQPITINVPANDILTGEVTCHGDSGGPLFDAQGLIVGVTSRGVTSTCVNSPAMFAGVAAHAELIRSVARTAGHPLDATTTTDAGAPPPSTDAGTPPSTDAGTPPPPAASDAGPTGPGPTPTPSTGDPPPASSDSNTSEGDDTSSSPKKKTTGESDEEDESDTRTQQKRSPQSNPSADDAALMNQANGCHVSSLPLLAGSGSGPMTFLAALVSAIAARRRSRKK